MFKSFYVIISILFLANSTFFVQFISNEILIPAIWLIIGVLSSTAWNLSLRKIMKGEHDEAAASTVSNFLGTIATVPFILFLGANFAFKGDFSIGSTPPIAWAACIAGAIFTVVFSRLSFKASKVVEASERAIFSRLNIFWALLFAAIFLGEGISLQKALAVIIIFAASCLSVYKPSITKWKTQGLQLVIFASAFSAANGIASKFGVGLMPPFVFSIFECAFLTLGLYLLIGRGALSRCIEIFQRKPYDLMIIGIADAVFVASSLVAFALLPASVVIPILATAVVLTAIFGGILLNEKEGWMQKIAGAMLALVGVFLISGS